MFSVLNSIGDEDKRVYILIGEQFTLPFNFRISVDLYLAVDAIHFCFELYIVFESFKVYCRLVLFEYGQLSFLIFDFYVRLVLQEFTLCQLLLEINITNIFLYSLLQRFIDFV